jgi:hypothetical protein
MRSFRKKETSYEQGFLEMGTDKLMKRILILASMALYAGHLMGQSYVGEAQLPKAAKDGFHRIVISPAAGIGLNNGCTNIRIFDKRNIEVPYLFQAERPIQITQRFREYEIVEKRQVEGCCTILVLHNPDHSQLNNISLHIKNAEVSKEAILLGSDDRQDWFALKDRFILQPSRNSAGTSEIKIVDFPLSNYEYYSVRISDSTNAPLNILRAGYFETQSEHGAFTEIPLPAVVKSDSVVQKQSFFHFQFDTVRLVDRMVITLEGSPYFLRKGILYEPRERILRKGGTEKFNHLLREIRLTSTHPAVIDLPQASAREFLLVVENDDNPPLEIGSYRAYQLNRSLTAFLKGGEDYVIKLGAQDLSAPTYDISFFEAKIPAVLPELVIPPWTPLGEAEARSTATIFTTETFIWVAVVLVIIVLGYMSVRMLRETREAE